MTSPATTPFYLLMTGLLAGISIVLALLPARITAAGFTRTMALIGTACGLAAVLYDVWFRLGPAARPALGSRLGGLAAGSLVLASVCLILLARRSSLEPPPGAGLARLASLFSVPVVLILPCLLLQDARWDLEILAALGGLAGAALLGSGLSAMLLGHSYLVVPGLSIAPLRRLCRGFVAASLARCALDGLVLAATGTAWFWPQTGASHDPLADLLGGMVPFLMHVLFGLVGPLILGMMAARTVALHSTQSATGILYGAVVFVLIGESAALHLLVAAGIPL
ncbi:MAG: hypothetical protein ACE5ID_08900 [Acidobacteriota bacterium]